MNEQYTRAPHRSTPSGGSPSPNAALLIDFDNVTMAMRSNLGQELRNFLNSDIVRGKVSVQRAYADWRRYPQYIVPLSEASIDLIFAPAYGSSKKNATDIRLAIDALELVFTRPEIGTYILLSGDSDFSSLVLKLKEYGKYVIGVGLQESSSDLLVQNCDEYYSYNSLSGLTSADELSTQSHDPWELVERAIHRMDDRDDVMRSDRLKQVMLEMDAGFDEKDHGFSKFNRFLAEASSRGLVKLRKIGDGQYEVKPARELEDGDREAAGEAKAAKRSEPERSERKPEPTGRGGSGKRSGRGDGRRSDGRSRSRKPSKSSTSVDASSLRAGYDLLRDVVADLAGEEEPVRDSEVKREMLRREESFDEAALGFSKFSRFLRQAHDEEVVDVAKDEDGNYHLAPAGSGIAEAGARAAGRAGEETAAPDETAERAAAGTEAEASEGDGASAGPAEEPEPSTAAGSDRRRGRGLSRGRRGSRGRGARSSSGDEGDEAPAPGPVDEGGGQDRQQEAAAEPATSASGGASGSSPADDGSSADDGGGRGRSRRRGGLGRFRKGSRGGGPGDASSGPEGSDDDSPTPGPVDGGAGDDETAGAGAEDADRSGPAARSDRSDAGDGTESSGPEGGNGAGAPVPDDAADDPVAHMVGRWPGVGRKTAEKLVEAFGDDVFEVIDRSPDRLTEVLPDHRAQAVVEARREERERVEA